MKYRKKPVVVEAMQVNSITSFDEVVYFFGENSHTLELGGDGMMYIRTLEGLMRVNLGDYIIKGVQGEFYPCKPDIFEQTYEFAE